MMENKKYFRVIDMCLQLIYIFLSYHFIIYEVRLWELTGDGGGMMGLFQTAIFICVNVFFFFIQLLAVSIKWKKIIFIFHNVCLFGFNFFLEVIWSIEDNKFSSWIFYIILFIIGSYLLYDYLLSKITGGQEPAILDKLIFNRINRYFPN